VPQLALASPVGTLTVTDDPVTSGIRVLTYPSGGGEPYLLPPTDTRSSSGAAARR
jgi:hypothetical protein